MFDTWYQQDIWDKVFMTKAKYDVFRISRKNHWRRKPTKPCCLYIMQTTKQIIDGNSSLYIPVERMMEITAIYVW